MKPEPLKDKKQDNEEIKSIDYEGKVIEFFDEQDIKSAVEWYKKYYCEYQEYISTSKRCSIELRKLLEQCKEDKKELFFELWLLDKAFEDVMKK